MKTSFVRSGSRSAVFLLCFLLYSSRMLAQIPSCSLSGDVLVCKGDLSEYHLEVDNITNYFVDWNFPNGIVMGHTNNMAMVHWETSGVVTAVATIYNSANNALITSCSIDIAIENLPKPQIVPEYLPTGRCITNIKFDGATTGYCAGSEVRFLPVGGSSSSFTWTLNGVPVPNPDPDGSVLIQMDQPGTFELCLEETNAAGCVSQVCENYYIYSLPEVDITELSHGDDNTIHICRNEDLLFTGTYEHPDNFAVNTWYWTVTAQNSSTILASGYQSTFSYTFATSGTYEVHLYATNCLGCASETETVTVIVNEDARPEIICPSVVCQSDSVVTYCTPASCESYTWSVSGGTIQGSNTASCVGVVWNTPLPDGFGWVTLQPVKCSEGFCTEPATVEVPVIPAMQPIFGPTEICDPFAKLVYSVPYWPGATYTWSREIEPGSTGVVNLTQPGQPTSASIALSNFNGTFKIKVRIQHPISHCDVSSELVIHVRNFQITGPSSICPGEDLAVSLTPTPSPLPYTIEWKIIGTGFSTTVADAPNVEIPASVFPESGFYTLIATLTFQGQEPFSCDALSQLIYVKPPTPPVDDIIGPHNVCPDQFYDYSASPASPGTFSWDITGGTQVNAMDNFVAVIWDDNQPNYSLTVIRTVDDCPSEPFTLDDITEIGSPNLNILGPGTVCEDAEATYMSNIDGGTFYNWNLSSDIGSILSGQGTSKILVQWHKGTMSPSSATIQLSVNVCGAPVSAIREVSITRNGVDLACPSGGCRVCAHEELLFTASNGDNEAVYDWLVNGNKLVMDSDDNTFTTTFTQPGTQYVRVHMTGGPSCPGDFEDVVAIDVVPNPAPILTYDRTVDCENVEPVTIYSTSYPGADNEIFEWSWDGGMLNASVYTATNGQLIINGSDWSDYEGTFTVHTEREIDGVTCDASSDIVLECQEGFIVPDSLPDIQFTSWEFNLGQPCTTCRSATPNACGYVIVHGDLLGQPFDNVQSADWRVVDFNNGLNPDDVFPADGDVSQIEQTNISVFSKAGYYPTNLRVKFLNVSSDIFDQRTIKIPIQPGFIWSVSCSETPGMYDVLLRDISERLPGVGITGRDWDIEVLGGASETVSNEPYITLLRALPAGAQVKVCITPYADENGMDMARQTYFCTYCDTIRIPEAPSVHITADRSTVCSGTSVQFDVTGTGLGEIISYNWNFGDNTGSNLRNPVKSYLNTPAAPVTLTVMTSTGCTLTDMMEINVHPVGDLDGEIDVMNGPCNSSAALMFIPYVNEGTLESFEWNTGDTVHAIFVMQSGTYSVIVTDTFGCTVIKEVPISINAPFTSTLTDTAFCQGGGGAISFGGTTGFTYDWTTNIPDIKSEDNSTTLEIPASTPDGTYTVSVQASIDGRPCMTIESTVTIYPAPPTPNIQVDYTCDPFTIHVSTDPEQMLEWINSSRQYVGFLNEFYSGVQDIYEATASNIYGCKLITSVEVSGPPNADILSGCYAFCDTMLTKDTICLQPPPGSFDRWSWTLNGNSILDGSGVAQPLCLTKEMDGKILFSVVRHYDNSTIQDVDCSAVSDTFCLEVLECAKKECPSTLFQNQNSTFQCVLGGSNFDEQIAIISDVDIHYPPGYTYCTVPPVIKITSGGYFTNLVTEVYFTKIRIVSGYLHITDPAAYSTGLPGYVLLCDRVTGDTCQVTFQLDGERCDEKIWCMLMPAEPVINTYWVGNVHTTSATFTVPFHFVTGEKCDLTSDTIRLYTYPEYKLLDSVVYSAVPNPSVDIMCTVSFAIPTEEFNKLHCLYFDIVTNCELNCAIEYCFPGLNRPALDRSLNEEEIVSYSLDLVPNPASNLLTIKYGTTEGQTNGETGIEITNVLGQTVFRQFDSSAQGNLQVDVSDWQAGVYLVNLVTGDKKIAVKKLVKQ